MHNNGTNFDIPAEYDYNVKLFDSDATFTDYNSATLYGKSVRGFYTYYDVKVGNWAGKHHFVMTF